MAVLDDDEKKKAMLPFNSDERLNWHYVPMERKGLHYKAMTPGCAGGSYTTTYILDDCPQPDVNLRIVSEVGGRS